MLRYIDGGAGAYPDKNSVLDLLSFAFFFFIKNYILYKETGKKKKKKDRRKR